MTSGQFRAVVDFVSGVGSLNAARPITKNCTAWSAVKIEAGGQEAAGRDPSFIAGDRQIRSQKRAVTGEFDVTLNWRYQRLKQG